ncbi:MAG: adenine phosphoribosyltransferase [Ekhidna sp.]
MTLEERIKKVIRDVPDFPKPGIVFKDITPLLKEVQLSGDITSALADYWQSYHIDVIVGIESRGFIWGNALAQKMKIPFVPIRKKGKLPADTYSFEYQLEYGSSEVEIHKDGILKGQRVLIHDDLLATGGTALAAAELVKKCEGVVAGFSFLVELSFLDGSKDLGSYPIHSIISY